MNTAGVNVGDELRVTYPQILAISVEARKK